MQKDAWDVRFMNNTSYQYNNHYRKGPKNSFSGLSDFFSSFSYDTTPVKKLWPREMLYLYALNRDEYP